MLTFFNYMFYGDLKIERASETRVRYTLEHGLSGFDAIVNICKDDGKIHYQPGPLESEANLAAKEFASPSDFATFFFDKFSNLQRRQIINDLDNMVRTVKQKYGSEFVSSTLPNIDIERETRVEQKQFSFPVFWN